MNIPWTGIFTALKPHYLSLKRNTLPQQKWRSYLRSSNLSIMMMIYEYVFVLAKQRKGYHCNLRYFNWIQVFNTLIAFLHTSSMCVSAHVLRKSIDFAPSLAPKKRDCALSYRKSKQRLENVKLFFKVVIKTRTQKLLKHCGFTQISHRHLTMVNNISARLHLRITDRSIYYYKKVGIQYIIIWFNHSNFT